MDAKGFRHHELRLINVVPPKYEEYMDAKIITTERIQQNNIQKQAKGNGNERFNIWN